jgi:plasmid stability protein
LSTYVARAEADTLRERAAHGDRSVAAEIRRAIRSYLLSDGAPAGTGATPKSDVAASAHER